MLRVLIAAMLLEPVSAWSPFGAVTAGGRVALKTLEHSTQYADVNCVANAAAFFNNVRTPAALLTIP